MLWPVAFSSNPVMCAKNIAGDGRYTTFPTICLPSFWHDTAQSSSQQESSVNRSPGVFFLVQIALLTVLEGVVVQMLLSENGANYPFPMMVRTLGRGHKKMTLAEQMHIVSELGAWIHARQSRASRSYTRASSSPLSTVCPVGTAPEQIIRNLEAVFCTITSFCGSSSCECHVKRPARRGSIFEWIHVPEKIFVPTIILFPSPAHQVTFWGRVSGVLLGHVVWGT